LSWQRQQADAQKALQQANLDEGRRAQEDLLKAREQLTQAQTEAKEAASKLLTLKSAVKEDERGLVITVSGNVLFAPGKSTLLPASQAQLDEIARALVGTKTQRIVIEGFTDATGSRETNKRLSHNRAQAVVDYLASKGVPSDRMEAVGRGPERPIARNRTVEGRASNRRVEIVVQGEAAARR